MRRKEKIWGWVLIAPLFAGILAFVLIPLLYSLFVAFSEYDLINEPVFTGFDNVKRLFEDPYFWKSIGKSLINCIGTPFTMAIGLTIAVLSSKITKGAKVFRTVFFLPAVCSSVAITFMWRFMLDYQNGLINWFIKLLGFDRVNFFGEQMAMPSMIIMGVWGSIGVVSILYYSVIKNVSSSYYEAAQIDGANSWQCFRYITLPLISPVTFYILLTQLIGALQDSTRFMVMSGNGNSELFTTAGVYVYSMTFIYGNPGYASTCAWALGLLVILFIVLNFTLSKKWVFYDD